MKITLENTDFEQNEKGVLVARKGLYAEKLAEHTEVPLDTVKEVEAFNASYVAAAIKTSGEAAHDLMEKDPSISQVQAIANMYGRGNVAVSHTRHRAERIPKTDNTVDVYGGTRINISQSYGLKTGDIGQSRDYLKELAVKRFGDGE